MAGGRGGIQARAARLQSSALKHSAEPPLNKRLSVKTAVLGAPLLQDEAREGHEPKGSSEAGEVEEGRSELRI